jgi:hypothetical protein
VGSLVLGTLVSCSLISASSASAAATPLAPTNEGPSRTALQHEPATIGITMDSDMFVAGAGSSRRQTGNLRWTAWTGSQALATGAQWTNTCTPSCANSTSWTAYPVKVRLFRPAMLGGRLVFTGMTVTYTAARPSYRPGTVRRGVWTLDLGYAAQGNSGYYFWK